MLLMKLFVEKFFGDMTNAELVQVIDEYGVHLFAHDLAQYLIMNDEVDEWQKCWTTIVGAYHNAKMWYDEH